MLSLSSSIRTLLPLVLLVPTLIPATQAAIFTDPSALPTTEYDFIVVGAGTAGNVIASRLSEDSSKRVLVVEAGVDDTGVVTVHAPFLGPNNQQTLTDWNYTTVPQVGLNNRSITVPRGFVLGGSSSINFMVWTQGSADLFDSYAKATGDSGWSWDAIQPFWKKVSTFVSSPNNPSLPPPPASDRTLSNGNGPVQVNWPNYASQIDYRVINASKELESQDERFKYTEDTNGGDTLGFGLNQESTGGGTRSSSATAYLWPALEQNRTNLDVLIHTRAMRLVETDEQTFKGVEVAQTVDGPRITLTASTETILSAGAIGTPQLLLLSGIGPQDELAEVGVEARVDLSGVGKNLIDHPLLLTYYEVSSNTTFDDIIRNSTLTASTLAEWLGEANGGVGEGRKGLFSSSPTNALGFMRIPQGEDEDPSAGCRSAHTEIIFLDGFAALGDAKQPAEGHFLSVITAVVSPSSKGSLTLTDSTNGTFSHPSIDYGILSTDWDTQAMLQALRDVDTFLNATPWTSPEPFILEPWGDWAELRSTDEGREQYVRENTISVYHPVGSAKMGSTADSVVDARLRVRGVKGLRVVDASIFPTIPEVHPQAVIYTIAERAAQLIKEDSGMLQYRP
ncbi:hypothetical protein VKT23_017788 [Stygiomarasmius scandens]|uniref:Glucose-methanol-choline oxidoreductase N-terminal domain-containing protein n=1 Tax=Marasmiellus scandens TaxID=2682957 RepID=A0ABR1ITU6_9AGAR